MERYAQAMTGAKLPVEAETVSDAAKEEMELIYGSYIPHEPLVCVKIRQASVRSNHNVTFTLTLI